MASNGIALVIASLTMLGATFLTNRPTQAEPAAAGDAKHRVYEFRTYTTEPGRLPALLKRFRDHTTKLFEKHGMTNVAYWVPVDEPRSKDTLIYILAHDSRDAAKKSWAAFQADPDWIKVRTASEADGKIVHKVESVFANLTDFSPQPTATTKSDSKPRVFEIRRYTIEKGKLPDTLKLFRDPVLKVFKDHNLSALGYWVPTDEPLSQDTIIYILAHDSRAAAKKSWAAFKADPDWTKGRKAAETNGKLFKKTESTFAAPTDFSAIK